MFEQFLRIAIGPNMVKDTPVMKFYDNYIKTIYNDETNKKIVALFKSTKFGNKLDTFNDVEEYLSENKLNNDQIQQLFFNPEISKYLACALLANISIDILKSSGLYDKIKEVLINSGDIFCLLLYSYFTSEELSNTEIFNGKDMKYKLMYLENLNNIPIDTDLENKLVAELNAGTDLNVKRYYNILFNNNQRPKNAELNNYKYKLENYINYTTENKDLGLDALQIQFENIIKDHIVKGLSEEELKNRIKNLIKQSRNFKYNDKEGVYINLKKLIENKGWDDASQMRGVELLKLLDKVFAEEGYIPKGGGSMSTKANITKTDEIITRFTNYYIKNFLPGILKQAKSVKDLSGIVRVAINETQNLMFNDGKIITLNQPQVVEQVGNDIVNAITEDYVFPATGGAADNLSLKMIVERWKQQPEYKDVSFEELLSTAKKELEAGKVVELEHTNEEAKAAKIAADHLTEQINYYSYLHNMESLFSGEPVANKELKEPENFVTTFFKDVDINSINNAKVEDHVCDGSCGGNCQCHTQENVQVQESLADMPNGTIKPLTVEDKLRNLGDNVVVTVISEPTEVQPLNNGEEQAVNFIDKIAASVKR